MAKRKSLLQKPRSLLATIADDKNLSDAGLEDISEMCQVGSSEANLEVQKLDLERGAHAAEVEEVAKQVTEPAAMRKADDLDLRLRASQSTARRIGAQIERNLTVQWELQSEFRRRIPPHSP